MAKTYKGKKEEGKEKSTDFTSIFFLLAVLFIVFLIYSFSLNRTWIPFDENLIYKEELMPIPTSFKEIFEIINLFVFNYHILSINSFFSNHVAIRSNPITFILIVFISFFFKKSAFLYHILQLSLHLINVALVYLILKKTAAILIKDRNKNFIYLACSVCSLLWGLHSANTEAVLLVSNWTAILTYTFCFSFVLYEISGIDKEEQTTNLLRTATVTFLFCFVMLFTEYAYSLPFILFFIFLSISIIRSYSLNQAIKISFQKTLPYIAGVVLYILLTSLNPDSTLNSLLKTQTASSSFYGFFERSLWLSPQIFLNFFRLLLFPRTLSTFQSNLAYITDELINPFSIFCTVFYVAFLMLPLIMLLIYKSQKYSFISPLCYAFFFSLFPFLHIVSPTYCLIADRYCYFPSFILILCIFAILICLNEKRQKILFITLSISLLVITTRTFIRTLDWMNPISFYNSALKADKNPLYKAHKYLLLADFLDSHKMQPQMDSAVKNSLYEFNIALKNITSLKEKHPNQPVTLQLYGLDYDSLSLKAAHGIAIIKKSYEKESIDKVINFFEPYIEKRLDYSAPNEIAFYGDLLLKNGDLLKAKSVYEYSYKRFPFILDISLPLADFYFNYEKNEDKGFHILQQSYRYYPNKGMPMYKLLKYYEQKNDPINVAKFAYLLGLRDHSIESYQHAEQIYLDLNMLKDAKKTIDKLLLLNPNNSLTLLQLSRYLDLSGQRKDILEILNKAYYINKSSGNTESYISKAVLTSLINVNYQLGNIENTKRYLFELEQEKGLSPEDIKQINLVEERLKDK